MIFGVFILEPTLKKKHLDENDFLQGYGNYFGSTIKVLSQQLQGIITTAFLTHLTVKDFTDLDQHTRKFSPG